MKAFCRSLAISAGMIVILAMASCDYLLFDQPQPVDSKNLKEIPKELRGKWLEEGSPESYFIIGKDFYQMGNRNSENDWTRVTLSDTAVLRKAKGFYVFNIKRNIPWWEIVVIQKDKNGDIAIRYPVLGFMEELSPESEFSILDSTSSKDTTYLHAKLTSRMIEKIISLEKGDELYVLRADSTFVTAGAK